MESQSEEVKIWTRSKEDLAELTRLRALALRIKANDQKVMDEVRKMRPSSMEFWTLFEIALGEDRFPK